VLASQLRKALALIKVLPDQAFPTDQCQAGIGVCMHGVWGLGLLGRTTALMTSHPLVSRNNLVALQT
jgi:hypothetical protein